MEQAIIPKTQLIFAANGLYFETSSLLSNRHSFCHIFYRVEFVSGISGKHPAALKKTKKAL